MESLLSRLRGLVVYLDGMLVIGQMQAEHLKTLGDSPAAITECTADIPERQMCPTAPNLSTVLAPLYQLLKVTAEQAGTGI